MASTNELTVKLNNVSKRYADIVAVNSINMEVKRGEILGLLGPNGSGKSTTLKMILGLIKPDSGAINVFGKKLEKKSKMMKR